MGRIYQQTIIDTYSRVTFAKLYTSKHAITSADFLNDIIDAYRASGGKGISVYSKKEGGVKHIIGKRVYEFNSVAYPAGLDGQVGMQRLKSAYSLS